MVFRADGSSTIGLGHLFRCTALAAMLRPQYACALASRECPTTVRAILHSGFDDWWDLSGMSREEEFERLNTVGSAELPGVIVLDGYSFDTDYQRGIGGRGSRLVCIDDIHAYSFVSDLVINHAPIGNLISKYDLSQKTSTAFGLAFSLLRTSFLRAARESAASSLDPKAPFYIAFGGADVYNVSSQLILKLAEAGYSRPIIVVLGAANEHTEAVRRAAAQYPGNVVIHQSLDDDEMIKFYRSCALAFLPASTTLVEAMAAGARTLTGFYVDNQHELYRGFVDGELTYGLGDWKEIASLDTGKLRETVSRAATASVRTTAIDGFSDLNLRALFDQLLGDDDLLVGRPATDGDAVTYFDWVNEAAVRQNSIDQTPVVLDQHIEWFRGKLRSDNSLLLYYEYRSQSCGQVRFDLNDRREALLDYSIDHQMRGRGFGARILGLGEQQLRARFPDVSRIVAVVKTDNPASQRALETNEYRIVNDRDPRVGLLTYEKQLIT